MSITTLRINSLQRNGRQNQEELRVNAERRGRESSAFLHNPLTVKAYERIPPQRRCLRFESESLGREGNHHGCSRTPKERPKTLKFSGSQPSLG